MTSQEMIQEAVKILREDPGLYELAIEKFTARDLFFLIYARFNVRLTDEEITEELLKNDSVESFFRLKWEPLT